MKTIIGIVSAARRLGNSDVMIKEVFREPAKIPEQVRWRYRGGGHAQ